MIKPVIVCDGRALGYWKIARSGKRAEVRLLPFSPLDAKALSAIEAEVSDIGRFEGVEAILRAA